MKSVTEGEIVVARLEDGEDLLASVEEAAREHGVLNGCLLFGVGQLRDFELGFFDGTQYEQKTYLAPHELVGLHGTIALNANPSLHLHAALSSKDFAMIGGHLFRATVATVGEICMSRFSSIQLGRELDSRDGLLKLTLRQSDDR